MNYLRLLRIFSVPFAPTVCISYLNAANAVTDAGPLALTITCTQGAATCAPVTTTLTLDSGNATYSASQPTVSWLTVSNAVTGGTRSGAMSGSTSQTLWFSASPIWTTLNPGYYPPTTVTVTTTPSSIVFTVALQINAAAPILQVNSTQGLNVLNPKNYTPPNGGPTGPLSMSFSVVSSSGLSIPFTYSAFSNTTPSSVAGTTTPGTAGGGWLSTDSGDSVFTASAVAYSWGTNVTVYASLAALAAANTGDYLTGTIVITTVANNPQTLTVPVNINVNAATPGPITVSPALVPLLTSPVAPGSYTFTITGTNFVASPAAQQTHVFYGLGTTCSTTFTGCVPVAANNVTVLSPTYMQVTIPYPSTGIPFASAGATALYIGIANGASPSQPVHTAAIGVTSAPIIYGVTSASSFYEWASPRIAPYDIISIFGTNFCPTCTGSNSVLVNAPSADAYQRYPLFVSPDGGTTKVSVFFGVNGTLTTSSNLPQYGVVIFATNNQINVVAPGGLTAADLYLNVAFDTPVPPAVSTAAHTSLGFPFTFEAVNPGIFTMESSGQGQGAILNVNPSGLNGSSAAVIGSDTASDGTNDVQIFLTGLGVPDASGKNDPNASGGTSWGASNSFNCLAPLGVAATGTTTALAPTGYMGTINSPGADLTGTPLYTANGGTWTPPGTPWTTIDGAVLMSSLFNPHVNAPCFLTDLTGTTNYLTVTLKDATGTTQILTSGKDPLTFANGGITYAGWVSNSIVGLYQINLHIPALVAGISAPTAVYIQVTDYATATTFKSQPGVLIYVNNAGS